MRAVFAASAQELAVNFLKEALALTVTVNLVFMPCC
jgi:hypothetical protein